VDLDKIRQELQERKAALLDKQNRISRHTRHREEPLPQDFAEQATELENQEVLVALDREVTDELRKIERAMIRIEADEYAFCVICGEEIPEARLQAIPTTDRCVECAAQAEKG
jgi:DnaK suppressor protein